MILGVNGIRLVGNRSGVGRMIENVLKYMDNISHPFTKIVVYTPERLPDCDSYPGFVEFKVLPSRLPPALWEQWVLLRAHPLDYPLFCPSYIIPLFARCPTLLVHHGSYEGYKEAYLAYPKWSRFKAYWGYRLSARRATLVTTVSEYSRQDMAHYYGVDPGKIEVIPDGVDLGLFKPIKDKQLIANWKRKVLGDDIPFILYVGKPTRRRNLSKLLRAFASLRKEKAIQQKLVLIGMGQPGANFKRDISELSIQNDVITVPFADQEYIALAYNSCDLFVYPSSYEGFGMPVLEAMACGAPVITLNNTAFPEFASDVAELLPDAEPETLSSGILSLLENDELRATMTRKGPIRASGFDWNIVTQRYVAKLMALSETIPGHVNGR